MSTFTITRRQMLQAGGVGAAALVLPAIPTAVEAATATAVAIAGDPLGPGFWILYSNGTVVARGSARRTGGTGAFKGVATALVAFPSGRGLWRVKRSGRAVPFGQAALRVPLARKRGSRVVGAAVNPRGDGMWRVTALGKVLASGSVRSLGRPRSSVKIAAMAGHPEAAGYWILDRAGRVFGFGAARVRNAPIGRGAVGIAAHPSGDGYWLVKRNGNVYAFGASAHHGNARFDVPVAGIAAAPDGAGYWILARDGRVRAYGSARSGILSTSPPPEPTLTTVGGIVVASDIGRRVRGLLAHARDDGFDLGGWGYRSYARQVQLRRQNCGPRYYDVYVTPSSECSPMTARPGLSMHERGLAIDFYRRTASGGTAGIAGTKAFRWMATNAKTYGLYNLPSEPWHWSTNGR